MSSNLLRVVQEQQETIEKQSRLIADLIATLESWEQTAGYDGEELKERAKDLQLRERQAFTKPSVRRRKEVLKAVYKEQVTAGKFD